MGGRAEAAAEEESLGARARAAGASALEGRPGACKRPQRQGEGEVGEVGKGEEVMESASTGGCAGAQEVLGGAAEAEEKRGSHGHRMICLSRPTCQDVPSFIGLAKQTSAPRPALIRSAA